MRASEVNPHDWNWDPTYPPRVLFDNGIYSVIWGKFKEDHCIGARWNGEEQRGYPGQGAHPTWYVEPGFLAAPIVHHLHHMGLAGHANVNMENVRFALTQLAHLSSATITDRT